MAKMSFTFKKTDIAYIYSNAVDYQSMQSSGCDVPVRTVEYKVFQQVIHLQRTRTSDYSQYQVLASRLGNKSFTIPRTYLIFWSINWEGIFIANETYCSDGEAVIHMLENEKCHCHRTITVKAKFCIYLPLPACMLHIQRINLAFLQLFLWRIISKIKFILYLSGV